MSDLVAHSGSETILVVDDEPAVLSITSAFLARSGYDVLRAAGGEEALQICDQRSAGIHLLLTDITMPKMTGPELAERVLLANPDIRVLYMSGYGDYQFEQDPRLPTECYLQKPFTCDALVGLVRQALDAPRKREPGRQRLDIDDRKALG